PVPEGFDAVQHLARTGEEAALVESGLCEGLGKLVGGVGGVLVLDPVVPGPEGQRKVRALPLGEDPETGDQLFPEPGRRPVLDGVGGTGRDRRIVGAVDAQELVAEERGGVRGLPTLPEVAELETERLTKAQQPPEAGGREA